MNAIHFQINYEWQVFEPIKRAPYFICSKFNSRLCFTSAVWHVYCRWKMKAPGVRDKRQQFYWAPAKWRFDRLVAEPVKWNARSNFTQKGSDVLSCPQTLNTNWINDSGSTSCRGRWCAIHNSLLEGYDAFQNSPMIGSARAGFEDIMQWSYSVGVERFWKALLTNFQNLLFGLLLSHSWPCNCLHLQWKSRNKPLSLLIKIFMNLGHFFLLWSPKSKEKSFDSQV